MQNAGSQLTVHYTIVFQGSLEASEAAEWFEKLDLSPLPGGHSLLCGFLADQSALHGVLARLLELGLPLLLIRRGDYQDDCR